MNPRTKNIYFQPRYESDAQYEQNVIKHLITVLERVDTAVTETLLDNLLPNAWTSNEETSKYEYDIEVRPDEDPNYDEAYVLGISNYASELDEVKRDDKDSRADGQITAVTPTSNRTVSVILEAKTGTDTLSAEQLTRYKHDFGASDFTTTEWASVHGIFEELQVDTEVDSFLIDQYAEFLMNEEMEGVVAESRHTDGDGNVTQINQILIRYEATLDENRFALRFLSWHRKSADEDFKKNYSAWFSAEDFSSLFGQIETASRWKTFVGVENHDREVVPSLDPLIEWAENRGYGPQEAQNEFKGSHQRVVAEITDRNGHFPELRLDGGEDLRFSRLTENASANIRKPTNYNEQEFSKLMSQLNCDLRETVFVDFEFEPLWKHYIGQSPKGT